MPFHQGSDFPLPAAVVAQRLSELLLSFPAASVEGVQWHVLARKYEERHKGHLNIQALGHSSALSAATTLLWDVLRIVNTDDIGNPVVGVEDAISLVPRPGLLGCWPSLYRSLCDIVLDYGSQIATPAYTASDSQSRCCSLLLSQVRPLLERYWHSSFDESGLGFLSEDGGFVRLKKLKHLLHSVLRWRDERQAWRQRLQAKPTPVDDVLEPCLRLMVSDKHNDLLLQCTVGPGAAAFSLPDGPATKPGKVWPHVSCEQRGLEPARRTCSEKEHGGDLLGQMQRELERLRSENESLRAENFALHTGCQSVDAVSDLSEPLSPCRETYVNSPPEIFDDPFEPPPQAFWTSCGPRQSGGFDSVSEFSDTSSSTISGTPQLGSGAMTPAHSTQGRLHQACAFVPVWFSFSPFNAVDVSVIPRGIVQTARDHFEKLTQLEM